MLKPGAAHAREPSRLEWKTGLRLTFVAITALVDRAVRVVVEAVAWIVDVALARIGQAIELVRGTRATAKLVFEAGKIPSGLTREQAEKKERRLF
jgi:hypothetical protein